MAQFSINAFTPLKVEEFNKTLSGKYRVVDGDSCIVASAPMDKGCYDKAIKDGLVNEDDRFEKFENGKWVNANANEAIAAYDEAFQKKFSSQKELSPQKIFWGALKVQHAMEQLIACDQITDPMRAGMHWNIMHGRGLPISNKERSKMFFDFCGVGDPSNSDRASWRQVIDQRYAAGNAEIDKWYDLAVAKSGKWMEKKPNPIRAEAELYQFLAIRAGTPDLEPHSEDETTVLKNRIRFIAEAKPFVKNDAGLHNIYVMHEIDLHLEYARNWTDALKALQGMKTTTEKSMDLKPLSDLMKNIDAAMKMDASKTKELEQAFKTIAKDYQSLKDQLEGKATAKWSEHHKLILKRILKRLGFEIISQVGRKLSESKDKDVQETLKKFRVSPRCNPYKGLGGTDAPTCS